MKLSHGFKENNLEFSPHVGFSNQLSETGFKFSLESATFPPIHKQVTFDKSLLTPANELEDSDDKLLKPEEVIYEAESPDEAALVYTAKGYGVTLMKRFTDNVLVQWPRESTPQEYQILAMLPFDSTRKMMSVLVRYPKAGF